MALSIGNGGKYAAIPLLSRLMRKGGNSSRLDAARTLLRVIASVSTGKKVFTLVDSWYMKWPYLSFTLDLGFQAIGQFLETPSCMKFLLPQVNVSGRGNFHQV